MGLKEDIKEILMTSFDYVYCGTCKPFDTFECEWNISCSLSEEAADNIVDKIMGVMTWN